MSHYTRPGNPPPREDWKREAAFERYDPMVCDVLNDLKSTLFSEAYHITKSVHGEWYLSPPKHVMMMHPVRIKLCFDSRNHPVNFQVTTYSSWTFPANSNLSRSGLVDALEKLFPRMAQLPAEPLDEPGNRDWTSELIG